MLRTDVAQLLADKYGKKNPPMVKPGDTVRVHQKIKEGEKERVQIFEGLVIAVKHGKGLNGTYTVRKIATGGVGVERTYPVHSPNVVKVERVKSAKVARAKLYYMRERMGKTARFKFEDKSPLAWDESAVVAEEAAVDMTDQDTAEDITEAVVEVANEQEAEIAEETPVAEEPAAETTEETK
jgi:large subunit ribosomal protein L19